MGALRDATKTLPGKSFGAHKVEAADDFAYHDPVDGSDAPDQGIRVMFEGGARIVYRLSAPGRWARRCASISSITSRLPASSIRTRRPRSPISSRFREAWPRSRSGPGRKAPTVIT